MKNLLVLLTLFLLFSCKSETSPATEKTEIATGQITNLPQELLKIDSLNQDTWIEGGTLNYSKLDGLVGESVTIFMKDNLIEKYTQKFSDSGKGGQRHYYAKNDKIFAVFELFEENSNPNKAYMVERYSKIEDNKVTETIERIADFEEDLINKAFQKIEPKQVDIARLKRIINQEDEFETTFQGFLESGESLYMLVGEPKPGKDAYTAALQIQNIDEVIETLRAAPKESINRKLAVQFEDVRDPTSGYTVQFYLSGKFK